MKKYLYISLFLLIGCKKDKNNMTDIAKTFSEFIKNTEWVGTRDVNGYQYPPPFDFKFNASDDITIYGPLFFFINNKSIFLDSLTGKIMSIDSLSINQKLIKAKFQYLDDLSITITDKKSFVAVSSKSPNVALFRMKIFPTAAVSIKGFTYGGAKPPNGYQSYPDVSTIIFAPSSLVTSYFRNGKAIQESLADPTSPSLKVVYQRSGARLYFSGYNESKNTIISYFGVLSPSSDSIWVHSDSQNARLPNYTQLAPNYGPIGQTPVITKQ